MSVGADLVGLDAGAGGLRAEQLECFVEQRHIGIGPHHIVHVCGSRASQQLDLVVIELAPCGETDEGARAEQVVEELRGGEHGPHRLERSAHLVCGTRALADRAGVDLVAAARGERVEQGLLDEPAGRVVRVRPSSSAANDAP